MATMTEINEHGLTTGILHPKLNNRFQVVFKDANDQQIAESVTNQIISISPFNIRPNSQNTNKLFSITVEDDVIGSAMDTVWDFIKTSDTCNVELQSLDGTDAIIETIKFEGVSINNVEFSGRDYNSRSDRYSTSINNMIIGKLLDNTFISKWVENLSNICMVTEHEPKTSPLLVHHKITFEYLHVVRYGYIFPVKGGV